MNPADAVHVHRDPVCGKSWPCANFLCVDPVERWCGKPPCMGEPGLHQMGRLTEAGHMLHVAEQDYRNTFDNATLATRCAEIRAAVLSLVTDANQFYLATRGDS